MSTEQDPVDPYRCYLYGPAAEGTGVGADLPVNLYDTYPEGHGEVIEAELQRLLGTYQTDSMPAVFHASPSPTWRDESLADVEHSKLSRFVTRVHLFERRTSAIRKFDPENAGRYLGFVCLRPPGSVSPEQINDDYPGYRYVIEAELVRPRHMFRPRYHLIQTTASSPRLGVLPFVSTVFMAPRRGVESSTCVHLAVSQALHLVMGRFGCKPISQREFEAHLWASAKPARTIYDIAREGVTLPQALDVVEEHCRGGGFIVNVQPTSEPPETAASLPEALADFESKNKPDIMQRAHRILTDTLANGLPVIMMVSHRALHPDFRDEPHAELVFGMRLLHSGHELPLGSTEPVISTSREDHAELPGIFVAHDSITGPYHEWTASRLLEAAYACTPPEGGLRGIRFLALGPKGMKMGLDSALSSATSKAAALCKQDESVRDLFAAYHASFCDQHVCPGVHADDPRSWRYVTRLMPRREVIGKYLPDIRLPADAAIADPRLDKMRIVFGDEEGQMWAVELLLPVYEHRDGPDPRNKPVLVFLWLATADGAGPQLTLVLRKGTFETYDASEI